MSSSEDKSTGHTSAEDVDLYEDVFAHHISEIEQVWQELAIEKAKNPPSRKDPHNPGHRVLHYPIKLSDVKVLANGELEKMRDNGEGIDGTEDGVAESVEKEAGVLLSYLGSMFIENLMIKTMYYLPQGKAFGLGLSTTNEPTEAAKNDSESIVTDVPPIEPSFSLTMPEPVLRMVSLEITREDVRRALLRDDAYDFLVQGGFAQPEAASASSPGNPSSRPTLDTSTDDIHLGYWKVFERTTSGLEMATAQNASAKSSAASSSSAPDPSAPTSSPSTSSDAPPEDFPLSHHHHVLAQKIMMTLTPEKDLSHRRLTLFPDNEDVNDNHIEFSLSVNKEQKGKASLSGRIRMAHIDILSPHGSIDISRVETSPIPFSWDQYNMADPDFPLSGKPTASRGSGSVQLMDATLAARFFPDSAHWLSKCPWGVLSLDMSFELGETGFLLHNHYLAIPVFVQPPRVGRRTPQEDEDDL